MIQPSDVPDISHDSQAIWVTHAQRWRDYALNREAKLKEATALLRECEWALSPCDSMPECQVCECLETQGHTKDCKLKAFLEG